MSDPKIALIIGSKGWLQDLINLIVSVPIADNMKYVIAADYSDDDLALLREVLGDKGVVVDERPYGGGGSVRAYDLAYYRAKNMGFDYAVCMTDDMIPQKSTWHEELNQIISTTSLDYGSFSTDEAHKGVWGWNFFGGRHCAHLPMCKTDCNKYLLYPSYFMYLADNDFGIRMESSGRSYLIPIRFDHNHKCDATRSGNAKYYQIDLNIFNEIHPEFHHKLDDVVLKGDYRTNGMFLRDTGKLVMLDDCVDNPEILITYDELIGG